MAGSPPVGWGLAYGILWWFLGALTILPLWLGKVPGWSHRGLGALFGSLVGHAVYGVIGCSSIRAWPLARPQAPADRHARSGAVVVRARPRLRPAGLSRRLIDTRSCRMLTAATLARKHAP